MIKVDYLEVENEFRNNSIQLISINEDYQQTNGCNKICKKIFCEFIFPISGMAVIKNEDKFINIEKGMVIHCPQNETINFEVIGNDSFNTIRVRYIINEDTDDLRYMTSMFMMKINNYENILKFLRNVQNTACNSEILSRFKLQLHTNLFINELFKKEDIKVVKNDKEIVLEIMAYISKNYSENITLKSLSEKFKYKSEKISYLFHKHLNVRPIEYLIQYRMTVAYKLLEEGTSVKEVAYLIGYNDEFYFSRIFKKNFGVSPNTIKKQL